ncbi:MAG: isocitrate/isopropylmalate family dehydrogenase, partial [Burkholderiaceae bacterium]|nr:isocitrate/isopropylmalate family dehydrogenase [Burkholderiaceae bacterium]
MTTLNIAVLAGDGIGPEITEQAVAVLERLAAQGQFALNLEHAAVGGAGYRAKGHPLPEETMALAQASDAVLFGSVGDFHLDHLPRELRPEQAILGLRKRLELFANLRPAFVFPDLVDASTLKPEIVSGMDILIVRELTGDIYFGQPRG